MADGAPWIWNNVPPLLVELSGRQVTQILDYYHACQQLYQAAGALLAPSSVLAWADKWKKKLKQGQRQALLNEMSTKISQGEVSDLKVAQTKFNYFLTHSQHGRLDYRTFQALNLPTGSGVIESLIRQVVNLRLKSSGKLWELEAAEGFLHARCQWVTNNWDDFCEEVLKFNLVSLPKEWRLNNFPNPWRTQARGYFASCPLGGKPSAKQTKPFGLKTQNIYLAGCSLFSLKAYILNIFRLKNNIILARKASFV